MYIIILVMLVEHTTISRIRGVVWCISPFEGMNCLPVYLKCLPVYMNCLPAYMNCLPVYMNCLPVYMNCLPVYIVITL